MAEGRKKVLVVDDDAAVRLELRYRLESAYEIIEAADGEEGLGKLDGVDAVLSDLSLPRMNGIDFMEKARDERRYRGLAFLISGRGKEAVMDYLKDKGMAWEDVFPRYFEDFIEKTSLAVRVPQLLRAYLPQ